MKLPNFQSWKEHEAFWGFIVLLVSIVILVIISALLNGQQSDGVVTQAKIRILDSAVSGLIAILGMAAQALFRVSQADKDLAAAAKATAEKVPPLTGEAAKEQEE